VKLAETQERWGDAIDRDLTVSVVPCEGKKVYDDVDVVAIRSCKLPY